MIRRRLQQPGDLARAFPRVHFIGIGGVGMSGIAEVLVTLGYQVSGSDQSDSAATRRLSAMGAKVFRNHAAGNIAGADVVWCRARSRRRTRSWWRRAKSACRWCRGRRCWPS
jgi:UDP-N-acetylmuramate--alanine ligase